MKHPYYTKSLKAFLIVSSIIISGCAHTYTINVVDENGPVPRAKYCWNLVRKCRMSLGGEGQTDESGHASFKSHPNANIYVIKDDKWSHHVIEKDSYSYSIYLESIDQKQMDLAAKTVLGIDVKQEDIPERGNY